MIQMRMMGVSIVKTIINKHARAKAPAAHNKRKEQKMNKTIDSEWCDFFVEVIRALAILTVIIGPLVLGAANRSSAGVTSEDGGKPITETN